MSSWVRELLPPCEEPQVEVAARVSLAKVPADGAQQHGMFCSHSLGLLAPALSPSTVTPGIAGLDWLSWRRSVLFCIQAWMGQTWRGQRSKAEL